MTIQEQIKDDLKSSMKVRDVERTSLLRVILGEFLRVDNLPADKSVTDEQAIKVIRKMRKDAEEQDLLFEVKILEYLPQELSKEELTVAIKGYIAMGAKNIGDIMKYLKSSGLIYDGKIANEIVKTLI